MHTHVLTGVSGRTARPKTGDGPEHPRERIRPTQRPLRSINPLYKVAS